MTMKLLQIVLLLVMSSTAMAQQTSVEKADSTICPDSVMALPQKKHPWIAAAGVTALNTSVQLYNRSIFTNIKVVGNDEAITDETA